MALHQLAQFAIESLFAGSAIAATVCLVRSWKAALPQIAQLRAELSGDTFQEVRTVVRTVTVRQAPARLIATTDRQRPAVKAPVWGELRAAA